MELSQWLAVIGGTAGLITAIVAVIRVYVDRRNGIDSHEISSGELELAQDQQSWEHLVEIVAQLRTDRDYFAAELQKVRETAGDMARRLDENATELSALRSMVTAKDDKIMLLTSDIVVLLEHINSGKQPPPPPLRGYRGKETHE
jgi:chromosome segregation ATPase